MAITIERSSVEDRPAILRLMDEARGAHLSAEERARQGFVQGAMDEPLLARIQADLGVFVLRDGPVLAGFAMTSRAKAATGTLVVRTAKLAAQSAPALPLASVYMHGPVAIDRRYRGQKLLTRLLIHVCTEMQEQFERGALFVEHANQRSLAVHRHYPMDEVADFEGAAGRVYSVFAFSPAEVVEHYR